MKNPQQEYQKQAIKNASPTELITKLYDFAIQACHKKEKEEVQQILTALIKSLNFDYEISETLFSLYEYCQRQAEDEEFEEIRELLEPVRDAWAQEIANNNNVEPVKTGGQGFVV